jgi:hypothetical protein
MRITSHHGVREIAFASIPPNQRTSVAKMETWINTVWIPANISGYVCAVHVFSIAPFHVTVYTGDFGTAIPANWWVG